MSGLVALVVEAFHDALRQPLTYLYGAVLLFGLLFVRSANGSRGLILPNAPIVGTKLPWEPLLLTRYRFSWDGWAIIQNGWLKFRDSAFTVVRPECHVTVLPRRYIPELQNLPDDKLYPSKAIVWDLSGSYVGIDILLGSHLGFQSVLTKLTPRIGLFAETLIHDEITDAIPKAIPGCREWATVSPMDAVHGVISRVTARLFVGLPLCRNEEWIKVNNDIVQNIFETVIVLRHFPKMMHPLLGRVLPSRKRLLRNMQQIHAILIPVINERRRREAAEGDAYQKPEDVLQWMMDLANEKEAPAEAMATRYVYTVLGSMHSVTIAVIDCIYELCTHPEYVEPLVQEIQDTLAEDGGSWHRNTASKLQKLDSFMKEVQRLNPVSAIGFRRVVEAPITLSDGLVLPRGTYICVATTSHQQDLQLSPSSTKSATVSYETDSSQFDGFRYYKKRLDPGYENRYQFTSTDTTHIHFGHGRYACPGRFVASVTIKEVLARFLLNYEWRFPPEMGRLDNLRILEFTFHDPKGRLQVREKKGGGMF